MPLTGRIQSTTACRRTVSDTFNPPRRGTFHLSLTVLITIGQKMYLALGDGPPGFLQGFTCPAVLGYTKRQLNDFRIRDYHPLRLLLSRSILLIIYTNPELFT